MTKKDTVDKPVNEDPVAQVATEVKAGEIITLSTGVRVKLTPVPAPLIDAVGAKIKEPDIPVFKDKDSGRVYVTSMAMLSISIHYHFLPIYQR